jgi:predicted SAM-dependent methyltransferase
VSLHLNIGCGEYHAHGWLNIDSWRVPGADMIADVRKLPFLDGVAARIYCGHVLEHLPLDDVPAALAELRRVLAADGRLMVVGPCAEKARAHWPDEVPNIEAGCNHLGDRPGAPHLWTPTEATTAYLLFGADFDLTTHDITTLGNEARKAARTT